MDSSNSGSFQSSSGGVGGGDNEEYDSRTQSISSFINPATHFNHNLNHLLQSPPPPPSSSSYHHQPPPTDTAFVDPSSASSFSHSPNPYPNPNSNPLHNLDPVWTRSIRSDHKVADFGSTLHQTFDTNPNPSRMYTNTTTGRGSDHHQVGVTIKNPKKRTRASRRPPTTVLTTDTSNFRQMVQEFTGIPAAPFSAAASSPFSRRLDLFGRGGDGGTGPLYPLRPSIQPQQPSFLNSTANILESGTNNNMSTAATSSNYQLPPDIHEFQRQPSTLLDLQNPILSFQSLLQSTLPQQVNGNTHQSNHLSVFPSSSKRWSGQDDKFESFMGLNGNAENNGGSNLNSGGDQVQGNEDSWICPSN